MRASEEGKWCGINSPIFVTAPVADHQGCSGENRVVKKISQKILPFVSSWKNQKYNETPKVVEGDSLRLMKSVIMLVLEATKCGKWKKQRVKKTES